MNSETLTEQIQELLTEQYHNWPLYQAGYKTLESVESKTLHCDGYIVKVQLNPGRIKSATAQVDAKSVTQRACFLCHNNRPLEQKGVMYKNDYIILCNPAPIFEHHYTIAHIRHVPQYVEDHLDMIFELSRTLNSHYTLIYNGPQSGASAPDHFHLQAFLSNIMPIEKDAHNNSRLKSIRKGIHILKNYNRTVISLTGDNYHSIINDIKQILHTTASLCKTDSEPLINLIVTFTNNCWCALLFLRLKHRPECYFREGEKRMIVSPGAVDMGGIIITPRREDFMRLDKDVIKGVYQEVSLPEPLFEEIIKKISA
jgi:hypothetical protein